MLQKSNKHGNIVLFVFKYLNCRYSCHSCLGPHHPITSHTVIFLPIFLPSRPAPFLASQNRFLAIFTPYCQGRPTHAVPIINGLRW